MAHRLQFQIRPLIRLEVKIGKVNLLEWLNLQKDSIKTYWRDRQGEFEMAGIGAADLVESDYQVESKTLFNRLSRYMAAAPETLRYYGGMRFSKDAAIDKSWQYFGGLPVLWFPSLKL